MFPMVIKEVVALSYGQRRGIQIYVGGVDEWEHEMQLWGMAKDMIKMR